MKTFVLVIFLSFCSFSFAQSQKQVSPDSKAVQDLLEFKKSYSFSSFKSLKLQAPVIKFKSLGEHSEHYIYIKGQSEESLLIDNTESVLEVGLKNQSSESVLEVYYKGKLENLTVIAREFRGDIKQFKVNINIKAKDMQLVSKENEGTIKIDAYKGALELGQHKGDLNISSYSVNSLINKLEGNLSLKCFKAENKIYDITGDVNIEVNQGDVILERMEGDFKYVSHAANILTRSIKGNLRANTKLGEMKMFLEEGGSVRLRSDEAKVNVYMPRNSGAHINIGSSDGDLDFPNYIELKRYPSVKVATGRLRGRKGGSVFVRSNKGDIRLIAR